IYTATWEQLGAEFSRTIPAYFGMDPRDVFLRIVDQFTPLKREQTEEDIGRMVAFLASEDARNITGQTINVDGGQVMD
ncbi:unnamed protein product, partial [marine sediment metagenome]